MRYNDRHFNHAILPTFCQGDALLAERIDDLVSLTRAYHDGLSAESDMLSSLQAAFEDSIAG